MHVAVQLSLNVHTTAFPSGFEWVKKKTASLSEGTTKTEILKRVRHK